MTGPVRPRGRPGPKPRLTQDEILDVALALMSTEGLEGLSLRRLGQELGVTARTLYGYFSSREALESELVARLVPMPPPDDDGTAWQSRLEAYLMDVHDAIARHPGVAQLFVARSDRNPATDQIREYLLERLLDGGLEAEDAINAMGTLSRYLLGCVVTADAALRRAREPDDDGELPDEGRFPVLRRISEQYADRNSRDATLHGLRLILSALAPTPRA